MRQMVHVVFVIMTAVLVVTTLPWQYTYTCSSSTGVCGYGSSAGASQQVHAEKLSATECLGLGFNSLSLQCDTCDTIARIIGEDDSLEHECLRCCSDTVQDQYEHAVLEVDKRMLSSFPNLPDFVKSLPPSSSLSSKSSKKKAKDKDASQSAAVVEASKKLAGYDVTVNYRFGARPQLYLYKQKGEEEPDKVIYVGTWNMEDFIDFIGSHLKHSS
jgi:hypothetical protein